MSYLQNRDRKGYKWAQKEGKLWVRVEVHKCHRPVEMKARCHLWKESFFTDDRVPSHLLYQSHPEEKRDEEEGVREGHSRCHAPLKRFPYHLTSTRRPAKDATRITSISSHQPARRPNCSPVFLSSPFTGICRLRLLCPGKRSKLCLTPLKVRITHFLQSIALVCLNLSGDLHNCSS